MDVDMENVWQDIMCLSHAVSHGVEVGWNGVGK